MTKVKKTSQIDLYNKIEKAASAISKIKKHAPEIGIILGTGLGDFAKNIQRAHAIEYGKIPYFPKSTVQSHAGRFILGEISGRSIVAMEGRFHFYEGYSLQDVTFPVRVMKRLGIKTLIVSNASGGMNSAYKKGELAVINDHINFMGANPLIGPNDDRLGLRFPDMIEPYSKRLITLAHRAAKKQKVTLHDAVYIGVTGPCLETKAEYRLMRQMGADLVGMSTVPEVIVAVHAGLEVLGMSVVTDLCIPEHLEPVNIEQIIKTAQTAEPILNRLIIDIIKDI